MKEIEELEFSKELKGKFVKEFGKKDSQEKLNQLAEAAEHFEAQRYGQAQRILQQLIELIKNVPEVHELLGLCHYLRGNYKKAIVYLEEFSKQTKSLEQYPVLQDCYRAIQDYRKVKHLWEVLNRMLEKTDDTKSENKTKEELLIEGRIVFAGALVDQGDNKSAFKLLCAAVGNENKLPKTPSQSQIMQIYALADVYDQSGSFIKAKRLFEWVIKKDKAESTDASDRLALMS